MSNTPQQLYPLGKQVTNAATRLQVTGAATPAPCYSLVVQALPGNTGNITLGDRTVVASTGVGALAVLAPGVSVTIGLGREFDAASIFFDVATSGDGLVGYVVAA